MYEAQQEEPKQDRNRCREQKHWGQDSLPDVIFGFGRGSHRAESLDPCQQRQHPYDGQEEHDWEGEDHGLLNRATISDEARSGARAQ